MNAIAKTDERPKRQTIEVIDAVPVLDTARFEHMQRIANVMAHGTLLPESLYTTGQKDKKEFLPIEQVVSNCFLIVNQSVRWGLDPFAVAQSVAVVHGKLCYEGKLVSAVLDAKLGIRLHHYFVGDPANESYRIFLSDVELNEEDVAALKPGFQKSGARVLDGSVAEWKTTGNNSPWSQKNFRRMLIYRGTRDWCRIFEPAIMLGVYTPDEMIDMSEAARADRARNITPATSVMDRLKAAQKPTDEADDAREGFSEDFVARETASLSTAPNSDDGVPSQSSDEAGNSSQAPADQDGDGDSSPPLPSEGEPEPISAAERAMLVRFAKDVLHKAADPNISGETLMKVEKTWAADIADLSDQAKTKAKAISGSMRAIVKGDADLDAAVSYFEEVLDCPGQIGGQK